MTVKVTLGNHEVELGGKYVKELKDSNDIAEDFAALRQRLQEDGYLLIRGLHDRTQVLNARANLLEKLSQEGKLDPHYPIEEGRIGSENKGAFWGGTSEDSPGLLDMVNALPLMSFFDQLFAGPSITYDFKWARSVPRGNFTGAHYDIVYMGRGTKNLYTLWSPLGDISYEMGGLALCLGSQHFEKIKQTYGQMDVDRDNVTGWFSNDPVEIVDKFGGVWATTEFQAGDALIFGMYMMHCSLTNKTDHHRLSVDTRYQLSSEPVDDRWVGKKPKAHYAWGQGTTLPMEDARAKWGV